jgi:hypothetical protein
MLLLYFRWTGWQIGIFIAGSAVVIALIVLYIFLKRRKAFTPSLFCACSKPGHGFSTTYIVIFYLSVQ